MVTTSDSTRLIAKDLTRSLAILSKHPQIVRELKFCFENIGQFKAVDDFIFSSMQNLKLGGR